MKSLFEFLFAMRCEVLKRNNLIVDYEVSSEETNFRVSEEGELISDLVMNLKVVPVAPPKKIYVDFKISKTDEDV